MMKHPIVELTKANEWEENTINELAIKLPQSHFIDLHVRINGEWKIYQADWLKRLFKKMEEEK